MWVAILLFVIIIPVLVIVWELGKLVGAKGRQLSEIGDSKGSSKSLILDTFQVDRKKVIVTLIKFVGDWMRDDNYQIRFSVVEGASPVREYELLKRGTTIYNWPSMSEADYTARKFFEQIIGRHQEGVKTP